MTPRAPAFRLAIDSQDITAKVERRVESITLTDNRGFDADQVEIVLLDHDGKLDIPTRGAKLTLALGYAGEPLIDKGTFVVDDIEHQGAPDKLILRASSADLRAGLSDKKERSWHRQTMGAIVRTIAKEAGLQPAITADLAKQPIAHIDQTSESDINLLSRLAAMFDAVATVKAGRLLFIKAGAAQTASGQPLAAVTITRQDGDSHHFTVGDREAYTSVQAHYQDTKGAHKGTITWPDKPKRKKGDKRTTNSTDSVKTLRHTYANSANAKRAAKSEWERIQRGMATFSLTLAHARPELFPELPATVQGFKSAIDALPWIVTKATHRLADGFTTEVELEVAAEALT
ncbi:late control protein D [Chitinimonas prasina]|uniref:Late control protein D n=1 Tax=Chitinimonas prasina TaxID=1434937 RepID=A0ABQ5YE73_9NEIS|nr:phage late control D family protein [Chitinimonas prasina]GLR13280.1 late control protein D [Chitinimonas prasina]